MSGQEDQEICILQRECAENRARQYQRIDNVSPKKADPLPDIPNSLLCAEHIRDYVNQTGMIAPFFINGGKKSRLKDASYEGRIGRYAYEYKETNNFPTRVFNRNTDKNLVVPKNSIVFVECDLDFRLPEFIALRFNLQIKHVHRGLLLGTGPIVDPGYWGKLCIPLHNLTDEDYIIDKNDGLIWIEFTKTTSNLEVGVDRIGRPPLEKQFWDIKDFLEKATKPIQYSYPTVGIRSAIPSMHDAAVKASEDAAANSKKTMWISGATAAAVVIALYQLTHSYYSDVSSILSVIQPNIFKAESDILIIKNKRESLEEKFYYLDKKLNHTVDELKNARARIDELEGRLVRVKSDESVLPPNSITPKDASDSGPADIAE